MLIDLFCHTGSGKTHTLIGDISSGQQKGLLARAVNEIAVGVAECADDCYFLVINIPHAQKYKPSQRRCKMHY